MKPPSRSPPPMEENVPALRILARHCMPHAAVPWLVSEHVVMPFTAVPSMEEIERATESAHRKANAKNASTVGHEVVTARNAVPVAMLLRAVDANQLPRRRPTCHLLRWAQRVPEQLCSLSHNAQSLNQLTSMMAPGGDFLLRPFLRQWCLLRLCDAELPETAEEQQLLDTLFPQLSHVSIQGNTPFLVPPAGRDEFFLRVARRLGSRYVEGRGIQREAAVLHRCLEWTLRSHTDLNVFATAEFFDGFFLKFAWLHRNDALLSVIAHSSTERCRALLTPAFRDAYFLGTIDRLQCGFDTKFLDPRRSAPQAVWQCMQLVTAALAKGVRIPCTAALANFIVSLTGRALALTTATPVLLSTVVAFEKILRASTDFAPARTAKFRDSFFLKAADRFKADWPRDKVPGDPMLIHILALVTQDASPAEIEVFATEGVRDRLIVPLSHRLTDVAYMRYLHPRGAAELRAEFTAAFDTISRAEDWSLKAAFDTEVVRSEVLPRLAVRSRQPKRRRNT